MIPFLAKLFRGVSLALGATPPPPGRNESMFVLVWIGVIAFAGAFCLLALYLVLYAVK